MAIQKKNFPMYSRVKFIECNDLTDERGTILGKSHEDVTDTYIVLLDINRVIHPSGMNVAAYSITEACLEQITDCVVTEVELQIDWSL